MNTPLVILGILGGQELILIFLIILVLFGGTKIPQIMKGIGQGMHEFKKAKDGIVEDEKTTTSKETEDSTKKS
jgi:sec-independent protein translocase protein TatA